MPLSPENVEFYMQKALCLAAEAATKDEVPVGALLIQGKSVLGQGRNRREETQRTVAHAEIVALEEYSKTTGQWRLPDDTSLVVTVEPCLMCTGALLWARVSHIYYGCKDSRNAGLLRVKDLISDGVYDHRFKTVEGGFLSELCSTEMSQYFKKKRQ